MILSTGIIEGVSSRKDKTVKLTIGLNEQDPDKVGQLHKNIDQYVYLAMKTEIFSDSETAIVADLQASTDDLNIKSPSQRFRNVLFVLWKKDNAGFVDFNEFYRNRMERLIDKVKIKIERLEEEEV